MCLLVGIVGRGSFMRGTRKLGLCMRVVRRTVDGGGGQSVY
jgi:hypothetical protein